ncbi:hypothetical protein [Microbacterium ulmi]|uniref:hypothetical protein n=1 Tax=Microbacterium ulmi TaxID=179095 RepID=UPI001ABB6D6D|nr:hypothetical protein [Microbacterium ulmi]NII68760.1 hypothetical protein [Microbacterium ulmi]
MESTSTVDLATLWPAAQRVIEKTGTVDRATNASVRREWAAIDVELTRLGIPTYDRHGPSGPGRAWWTAQNQDGRIIGIWVESYEEAVIELAVGFKSPIAWCAAALLPDWVQGVARWNPMTWAVELGRGGLSGSYPAEGWWQLGGLLLLAALAFTWAVRSIRAYQRSI